MIGMGTAPEKQASAPYELIWAPACVQCERWAPVRHVCACFRAGHGRMCPFYHVHTQHARRHVHCAAPTFLRPV